MSEENVYANHNFILNGDFKNNLNDWTINDESKVTRQEGLWQGQTIGFMNAVNMGEGDQTITLASLPSPEPGRAEYKLVFWYEAVRGAVGTLRIKPSMTGEEDLTLVPSREAEPEQALNPDELLLDLNLAEYTHSLTLNSAETSVKFTVISPDNGEPGMPGAVRIAFVRVELLLEPLQLDSVLIDDEPQSLDEPLHLCFGANHEVALKVASGNTWNGTPAGLLVNGGEFDPERILSTSPRWGQEHPISNPWTITCAGIVEDKQVQHTLDVRSYYTADLFPLRTVCGHFQLDVIALQEAAYYPVIDLNQSVELRVRVESHYTKTPLANRLVIWTLKGPTLADDIVLDRQPSDENGEAGFTWTPDVEGDWEIEASVDSHYKKEDARHTFTVRALKEDPWLSASFGLDDPLNKWIWGAKTAYPNRGGNHEVTVAFPEGHALAETELALHWISEEGDTPEGLGIEFDPEREPGQPVQENGAVWRMTCENRRDSVFQFSVSCSKLLEASPSQTLSLAHNWLVINDPRQSVRFPVVCGPALVLSLKIHSQVPGVGGVSGVTTFWKIGEEETEWRTGEEGKVEFSFEPVTKDDFVVTARVVSPYDATEPAHEFRFTVVDEDVWAEMALVTLNGREEGRVGFICFRNAQAVELSIMPVGDALVGENLWVKFVSEEGSGVEFEVDPSAEIPREMTSAGLTYQVSSTSQTSARFQLHVFHHELPAYVLQGRLLSTILQEEGTLKFDDKELAFGDTVYTCIEGQHTLKFTPGSDSPLTLLDIGAWLASGDSLGLILMPDNPRPIPSSGVEWTLDAKASTESGEQGVLFGLPQAEFNYQELGVSLDHNRIEITEVRGPTFDVFVGETAYLEIKTQSHYTQRPVPGVEVTFKEGATSTLEPTQDNGWARFAYTATKEGPVVVIATVPSPYDGPDDGPSFKFEFTVLVAASMESPPSTTLTGEGLLMSEEQEPGHYAIEIGEVREAAIDPVVGEIVRLGVKVRASGTQRAASGVDVVFTAEQEPVRVKTDGKGWAYFAYKAEQAKDVQVVATLESVGDGTEAALSHTFRFKALAAGVWDDAKIQLNTEVPATVWGEETRFPRIPQAHTIKLVVDNASSHLLGRDVCLGLKGYSLPSELGITNVQPALGVARKLTAAGLSWQCTSTIGGACNLQLEASRLLKQSPVNAMSLGPMLPAQTSEAD